MELDEPDFDPDLPCIFMEMQETTDAAMIRELVEMYTGDVDVQLDRLDQGVAKGNLRSIADLAHTIAGSAATFGLKRVFHEARLLEEAADTGDFRQITQINQDIRTSFPLGIRAMRSYLEGM